MNLRVLGCSARLDRRHYSPGYLVNDELLLDGGTVNSALDPADFGAIRWAAVTHAHLDHVKELPFLAQSRAEAGAAILTIAATAPVIAALQAHIFNGEIWSDLRKKPLAEYQTMTERKANAVGPYRITPIPVEHTIPCAGLIVAADDAALAYTGDAAGGAEFWQAIAADERVQAVIVDTAYPDSWGALGKAPGHYTPASAAADIAKVGRAIRVLVTHMHPDLAPEILADYRKAGVAVEPLVQGQIVQL